jgi:hypothetical protein
MKANEGDNNHIWGSLWRARCCVSILNRNERQWWKLRMFEGLWFPASAPELITTFEKEEEENGGIIDGKSRRKDPSL